MEVTRIIIEEYAWIERVNEPVTVGIPFPNGMLKDLSAISLVDPEKGRIPLQAASLAAWPDGSLKWVLLDFQVSVKAGARKEIALPRNEAKTPAIEVPFLRISQEMDTHLRIDTGIASFFVDRKVFKPFSRVLSGKKEIIGGSGSRTILTDTSGVEYLPVIKDVVVETRGSLRTTVRIEGDWVKEGSRSAFAGFLCRLSFFAGHSLVKTEFTIHNPRAAKHPGGLWDLGDPGSIYFKDLSIYAVLAQASEATKASLDLYEDPVPMVYAHMDSSNPEDRKRPPSHLLTFSSSTLNVAAHPPTRPPFSKLLVYQDSSGGENWKCHNHVNRDNEVKNSFRGYGIYEDGKQIREGIRANPVVSVSTPGFGISGAIQYFWQNFPKAIEADESTLALRLFPKYYNDVFELQGGEQKTHTAFLDFGTRKDNFPNLTWVQNPLIARGTPKWYASSGAIPYLVTEQEDPNREMQQLINVAIEGENTFFHRREFIDEYGWRNFGDFYADHEAVFHKGPEPLVSHYNNQYDCIYGCLMQFMRSGNPKWFTLSDQLAQHVADIDIYHTDLDRPEYNHGMFWHTDHYISAETGTHRCFSKLHLDRRNPGSYGGGPSLSHNYTTGLLFHHYLTGSPSSKESVLGLADFVMRNMSAEASIANRGKKLVKRVIYAIKEIGKKPGLVQANKVYGLDGPGRASGNGLSTLVDAYNVSEDEKYLREAECLIFGCVSPEDDLGKKDLLDVENRWMYTVFLQALVKYLDTKAATGRDERAWDYAMRSLLHYALWMKDNERLYLETPDKLEYPNETWAAQEFRKCNTFLFAAIYAENTGDQDRFLRCAGHFYDGALGLLGSFQTATLTRPLALIMLNVDMYSAWTSGGFSETRKESHLPLRAIIV